MGDRACYRDFCPACDGPVTVVDETCPDCGARLDDGG
jgi:predicted amidophosphoribosyltransferase